MPTMQMKVATHSLCSPPNYQVPPLYPLGLNLPQGDRNPQPFKLQASHPTCTRRVFKVMGSSQPLTGPGAGLCGGPSRPTSFFLFEASSNTPIPDGRFEHQTSKNLNLVGRPLYSERLPTPPLMKVRCGVRGGGAKDQFLNLPACTSNRCAEDSNVLVGKPAHIVPCYGRRDVGNVYDAC